MGNIGPERRRIEVLPNRQPATEPAHPPAPANPAPAVEPQRVPAAPESDPVPA